VGRFEFKMRKLVTKYVLWEISEGGGGRDTERCGKGRDVVSKKDITVLETFAIYVKNLGIAMQRPGMKTAGRKQTTVRKDRKSKTVEKKGPKPQASGGSNRLARDYLRKSFPVTNRRITAHKRH